MVTKVIAMSTFCAFGQAHTHTHTYINIYVAAASSFLPCQTLKKRWGEREGHLNVSREAKREYAQMHNVSRIDHGSRSHE
jgi:hypothetical protein